MGTPIRIEKGPAFAGPFSVYNGRMSFEAVFYFAALAVWSGVLAYLFLFKAIPAATGKKKKKPAHAPHAVRHAPAHAKPHAPEPHAKPHTAEEPRPRYSSHDGFRSFAKGVELTVDDIVKGLSRE